MAVLFESGPERSFKKLTTCYNPVLKERLINSFGFAEMAV